MPTLSARASQEQAARIEEGEEPGGASDAENIDGLLLHDSGGGARVTESFDTVAGRDDGQLVHESGKSVERTAKWSGLSRTCMMS